MKPLQSANPVIDAMCRKQYVWNTGDYHLNLVGIRAEGNHKDTFNDWMVLAFEQRGVQQFMQFQCTTDPGHHWLQNPMMPEGTAILVPGQYRGMWQLGLHRGAQPALVQVKACRVYRDNNRDTELDTDELTIQSGLFGINMHRSVPVGASDARAVARWSAGCQVYANPLDFELTLDICRRSSAHRGFNSFDYTLLLESDLNLTESTV